MERNRGLFDLEALQALAEAISLNVGGGMNADAYEANADASYGGGLSGDNWSAGGGISSGDIPIGDRLSLRLGGHGGMSGWENKYGEGRDWNAGGDVGASYRLPEGRLNLGLSGGLNDFDRKMRLHQARAGYDGDDFGIQYTYSPEAEEKHGLGVRYKDWTLHATPSGGRIGYRGTW
jgi:hypothetical protein